MDTFLNDPFLRDTEAITSSFLDSMIPKDTVSNMNQFDFLVDIVEKKDKFHLSGELPGCNVANVDVKVDKDNNLHISAMKSIKHEEDEQSPDGSVKWHAIERSSGKVERIFALPEAADADKIDCSMKDGVLSIDIMKKPEFVGEPKELKEKEMKIIRKAKSQTLLLRCSLTIPTPSSSGARLCGGKMFAKPPFHRRPRHRCPCVLFKGILMRPSQWHPAKFSSLGEFSRRRESANITDHQRLM